MGSLLACQNFMTCEESGGDCVLRGICSKSRQFIGRVAQGREAFDAPRLLCKIKSPHANAPLSRAL